MWNYLWLRQEVRDMRTELQNMEKKIMAAFDELKTAIDDLGAKIDAYVATNAADIEARINEELAKDEALDNIGLATLKADVLAIANRIPPKVEFQPSGNG